MSFILKFFLFFFSFVIKIFSYTILTFALLFVGLGTMIYIYFGSEIDFIIEKLPSIYRQFLESQMLDISKSPMEVAPTAHYSMGGIKVNPIDL